MIKDPSKLDGSFSGLWTCELCNNTGDACHCEHFARNSTWGRHGTRFSDEELSSEYWCSEWRIESRSTTLEVKLKSVERAKIFFRFATLPHASETDYA